MKMNKEDMAMMDHEGMDGEKPMLKITIKAKPKKMEPEPGESVAHEGGEAPSYEKKEDVMPEEGEDSGEEDMGEEEGGMMGMSQAECDAHKLMQAAEIKTDPMRMKAALDIIGKKKKAIDSMEELMAVRKEKMLKGK